VRLTCGGFCVGVVCHLGWMTVLAATAVRLVESVIPAEVLHDYAAGNYVCVRPLLGQVTDRETGDAQRLVIPCGSTHEAVCPACAEKARRLRMQQCAEGWHLVNDPLEPGEGNDGADGLADDHVTDSEPVAESRLRRMSALDDARTSTSCRARRQRTGRWAGPSPHGTGRRIGPRCS
jgi:hypothetical protein